MTAFWWETLPRWLGRISQWWALILTDGYFLLSLPKQVTDWLSPGIALAGLLCGLLKIGGFEITPIEAPHLFYAFLAVGFFSGHLGIFLLIGFAVGDLITPEDFYRNQSVTYWLFIKLHQYIVFGIGIVFIPILTKQLVALLIQKSAPTAAKLLNKRFGQWTLLGAITILNLTLVSYFVFVWAQAMGLFIRTEYLGHPSMRIVQFFQTHWLKLAYIATAATCLRLIGQWSLLVTSIAKRVEAYEQSIGEIQPGWFDRLPKWTNAVWNATLLTFLLWYSFSDQSEKVIFGILAFLIYMLHAYSGRLLKDSRWLTKARDIPLRWRFLAAILVVHVLVGIVTWLLYSWVKANKEYQNFWFILVPLLIGLFVFSLLLPTNSTEA